MYRNYVAVWESPGGKALKAYTKTLAQELGMTLETILWGYALHPAHVKDPYNLRLDILEPFQADPIFWFTDEQVLGYATGATTTAIQHEIRDELEALKQERDEAETARKGNPSHPQR